MEKQNYTTLDCRVLLLSRKEMEELTSIIHLGSWGVISYSEIFYSKS